MTASTLNSIAGAGPAPLPRPLIGSSATSRRLASANRLETALAQITECAASLEQAKTIAAAARSPPVTFQVGEEDVRIDEWTC
jgi:citrate lyase beta subunit